MIKITLLGEPKSTSHIYHYHCKFGYPKGYMTKAGKDLKEDYQWQAKSQYHGELITENVKVEATLFFGTKRQQDIDNFSKIWADALSGIIYKDDKQITELHIFKDYDKNSPRVEIIINEIKI